MNVRWLPLGPLALLVIGVSCGGDGEPPAKDAYIADADDICRGYADKFEKVNARAADIDEDDPDAALVQELLQELLELNREQVAEVRDLDLPEGDEGEKIDAALDEVEQANVRARQVFGTPESALEYYEGDEEGGDPDPFAGVDEKLTDAGFEVCFSGEGSG